MRMFDPAHPGEIVRDCIEAEGWTVTACASRLEVSLNTLSRVLNGRARISRTLAGALGRIGWSNADHWLRMQASYDLAPSGTPLRRNVQRAHSCKDRGALLRRMGPAGRGRETRREVGSSHRKLVRVVELTARMADSLRRPSGAPAQPPMFVWPDGYMRPALMCVGLR